MLKSIGLLLVATACLTEACLITNCPRGGKRSAPRGEGPQDPQCHRCGPGLEGRCVGRAICCGPRFGCLVGSPAVLGQCSGAEPLAAPRGGLRCASGGVCLSDGVCCTIGGCKLDMSCEMEPSVDVCTLNSPLQLQQF